MSETVLPDDLVFHGNGGFYPPFGVITSKDHGPAVVVSTWIMMCLMGLAVIARFGTRHNLGNKDSVAIGIACILAVVQSVTIHLAAGHGLGRHVKDLNSKEYAYYEKTIYASQMLAVAVYYLAKLSLVLVFLRLTPSRPMRRPLWLFAVLLTLWTGITVVIYAVQCQGPEPWRMVPSRCLNQKALYLTYGTINIFTDLLLIFWTIVFLWDVQINRRQKAAIFSVFAIRITVCIAVALELASLQEYFNNIDKTWFIVDSIIWGQVSINLSIITACIPSVKPLFNMLQFSLIDSSIPLAALPSQNRQTYLSDSRLMSTKRIDTSTSKQSSSGISQDRPGYDAI